MDNKKVYNSMIKYMKSGPQTKKRFDELLVTYTNLYIRAEMGSDEEKTYEIKLKAIEEYMEKI